MPVSIRKTSGGKFRVATPNAVHAKGTTKKKAEAQKRLLNAVDHGWRPSGKKAKSRKESQTIETSARKLLEQLLAPSPETAMQSRPVEGDELP